MIGGFSKIPGAGFLVFYPEKKAIVGPSQFGAHCAPNWICAIKLAHTPQFSFIKTFPQLIGQFNGKIPDQILSILCPFPTLLFFLNNHPPYIPVGFNHYEVNSAVTVDACVMQNINDGLIKFGTRYRRQIRYCYFRCFSLHHMPTLFGYSFLLLASPDNLLQNLLQRLVRLPRLGLDRVQFLDDLRNGPVGFGVAGVDVAAGGDVVVVFLQLGVIDDAAEFFLFLPADEGVGDALDARRPG